MLIDQSTQLASKIRHLEALRRNASHAQGFRTRADQLSGPAERLLVLVRVLEVFRQRGIPVDLPAEKAAKLITHVRALARRYEQDPASIIQPDELRFTFWNPLGAFPKEVDSALRDAWVSFVTALLPTGRDDLLAVLARIPSFAKQVEVIRQGKLNATRLQQDLPQSKEVFAELETLAARLRQEWDQLQDGEISESVLTFLRAASTGAATLQLVTPEVRTWIERHGLLQAFKVVL
ncbi:hypothetical protein NKDENANG_00361 [Candidatus Entotheonellaceae bacterium PAL068K]